MNGPEVDDVKLEKGRCERAMSPSRDRIRALGGVKKAGMFGEDDTHWI